MEPTRPPSCAILSPWRAAHLERLDGGTERQMEATPFTMLQGQYMAFIVAYAKLNRRSPAEADFQRYCDVAPPSVHNMIVTLERRGLIKTNARSASFNRGLGATERGSSARLKRTR
jgi:repressor LexA